jgi:hypothetical protein
MMSDSHGYAALHCALEAMEGLINDAVFPDVDSTRLLRRSGAWSRARPSEPRPRTRRGLAFPRVLRDATVFELRRLRVVPVPAPDRLVRASTTRPRDTGPDAGVQPGAFLSGAVDPGVESRLRARSRSERRPPRWVEEVVSLLPTTGRC